MYVHARIYAHADVQISVRVYVYAHTHMYEHLRVYTHICNCVYIYTYVRMYLYTHAPGDSQDVGFRCRPQGFAKARHAKMLLWAWWARPTVRSGALQRQCFDKARPCIYVGTYAGRSACLYAGASDLSVWTYAYACISTRICIRI